MKSGDRQSALDVAPKRSLPAQDRRPRRVDPGIVGPEGADTFDVLAPKIAPPTRHPAEVAEYVRAPGLCRPHLVDNGKGCREKVMTPATGSRFEHGPLYFVEEISDSLG